MHVQRFLEEDIGRGDITSQVLLRDEVARGVIITKDRCVVAGGEDAAMAFRESMLEVERPVKDGAWVTPGTVVLRVEGLARDILKTERVVLNIMMRMCGIATHTRRLLDECRKLNPHIIIAATRKTTPGFRYFEKKAVLIGGGDPHRWGLDDSVLIKDNHIKIIGSVKEAVKRARAIIIQEDTAPKELRSRFAYRKIEVEVNDLDQVREAIMAGADIIMLDNMRPDEATRAYHLIKDRRPGTVVEISGGITDDNIREYARCGDVISIGALTHSYRSVDMSLDIEVVKDRKEQDEVSSRATVEDRKG